MSKNETKDTNKKEKTIGIAEIMEIMRPYKKYIISGVLLLLCLMIVVSCGPLFSGHKSYEITNSQLFLRKLEKLKELHICRYVVSDYKTFRIDTKGHIIDKGNKEDKGKELVYVTVCIVDAVIPLDGVKTNYIEKEKLLIVDIPKIQVKDGVIDEGASFVWENKGTKNAKLSELAKISQRRAATKAISMGIKGTAMENAERFFQSFFKNSGCPKVEVRFND